MLDIIPWTIIWVIVNFIGLFLLLRWLLLKPVSEFLEKRRQLIHEDLDNAKRGREEAQLLLEEHRRMISEGKNQAAGIIDEAVRQADLRRQELLAKAEEDVAAVLLRAKIEISREQTKAIEQLRTEVSALSISVAEKMLSRSVTDQDQDRIFKEVLEEMEETYAKYGS